MWTQLNPRVPLGVIALMSKVCFWQIFNIIIKFIFRAFLYLNPSTEHVVLNCYWAQALISYKEGQIGAWNRSCLWPHIAHKEIVSYKLRISWALSIYIYTTVQNYFQNFWRQTSKFTWNEVNNWCNFAVSFSKQYIFVYFLRHKCGLWK